MYHADDLLHIGYALVLAVINPIELFHDPAHRHVLRLGIQENFLKIFQLLFKRLTKLVGVDLSLCYRQ